MANQSQNNSVNNTEHHRNPRQERGGADWERNGPIRREGRGEMENGTRRGSPPRGDNKSDGRELGLVVKLTDKYGFIESLKRKLRVFFHFSSVLGHSGDLSLDSPVLFSVTTDQLTGKLVAYDVELQPTETVTTQRVEGKVTRSLYGRGAAHGKPKGGLGVVSYGQTSPATTATFTLQDQVDRQCRLDAGCMVAFTLVSNVYTGTARARDIVLVERPDVPLEYGTIESLKESFGFIEPFKTDSGMRNIFFHFSEFNDPSQLAVGMTVSYVVGPRQGNSVAKALSVVDPSSFEDVEKERREGSVIRSLSPRWQANEDGKPVWRVRGVIEFSNNGQLETVDVTNDDVIFWGDTDANTTPKLYTGDKVSFVLSHQKYRGTVKAAAVELIERTESPQEVGYISSLSERGGLVEVAETLDMVSFYLSSLAPDVGLEALSLGDEVSFSPQIRGGRLAVSNLKPLPPGSIVFHLDKEEPPLIGQVDRNYTDKAERNRRVLPFALDGTPPAFPYSCKATGLATRPVKPGDTVSFCLATAKGLKWKQATDVQHVYEPIRSKPRSRGKVVAVNRVEGNVTVNEAETGVETVLFYTNEVVEANGIDVGDDVEFSLATNKISGDLNACGLAKSHTWPARLPNTAPKFGALRQPKGPDGTRGFVEQRTLDSQSE